MNENLKDVRCVRCGGATMPGNLRGSRGPASTPKPQTWMPKVQAEGSMLAQSAARETARGLEVMVLAFRCLDCGRIELLAPKQ